MNIANSTTNIPPTGSEYPSPLSFGLIRKYASHIFTSQQYSLILSSSKYLDSFIKGWYANSDPAFDV